MFTDEEITDLLKKAGVVDCVFPFSEGSMRILKRFADEIDNLSKKSQSDLIKNGYA